MNVAKTLLRLTLGKRKPTWDGAIRADGLARPVVVRRDRFGVAYVDAETDDDAWFGLGFCHGQDRAGQLEITLRLIRGTLAAVAGADALPIDRLSRRLGLVRAGRAQLAVADADVQAQLAAYTRGVNAGMRQGGPRVAHELALLGCPPTPWEAADAQGFSVMMCFALAANWDIELVRLRILTRHGPEALAALDPATPEWLYATLPPRALAPSAVDALAADARAFADLVGLGGGSNAWVIAGSKTASGRPILANDPHLPPQAPAMWYLTRLRTPGWGCAGASFVGAPAMAAAHNGVAAWGVTALHADVTDLFLEELGPDGRSVREGDRFVACEVRTEAITVKGRKEPVIEEVLETPRGPIVGPAFDGAPAALSMSASWLRARPYRGLLGIHRAHSAEDFRRINAQSSTANTAMCFALADGTVGFLAAADVPIRRFGYGTVPLPGWDPRVGWDGVVDSAAMPFATGPADGFFATANNAPSGDLTTPDAPFLGVDWLDGYRATAIAEALHRRDDWDLAATMALQTDTTSPVWPELRDAVLEVDVDGAGESARAAQRMLAAWNGDVAADSAGASLWVFFSAALVGRIVAEKAPGEAAAALGRGTTELLPYNLLFTRRLSHMVRLVKRRPAGFFASATWDEALAGAMASAYDALRKRCGKNEARWAWGRVRRLEMRHPFGDKRPLAGIFNVRGLVCGGDASTIAQAAVDFEDPTKNPIGIATLRAAIDVGAWDDSRWVLLGGQSGNPLSPGYIDQTPLWERGEGLPIWWSDARRDEATAHTLTLEPLS